MAYLVHRGLSKGKKLLLFFVFYILSIELYFLLDSATHDGAIASLTILIRLLLTGLLFWCLYRGYLVAKWLSILCFGIGGIRYFYHVIILDDLISILLLALISAVYLGFTSVLLISKPLNEFLAWQRELRSDG